MLGIRRPISLVVTGVLIGAMQAHAGYHELESNSIVLDTRDFGFVVQVEDQTGAVREGARVVRYPHGSGEAIDTLVTDTAGQVGYSGLVQGAQYDFEVYYEGTNPFDELGELWAAATATIGTTASPLVMRRNWPYMERVTITRTADGWEVPPGAVIAPGFELEGAGRVVNGTDEARDVTIRGILDRSGDAPWDQDESTSETVPAQGALDLSTTFTVSAPGVYLKAVRTEVTPGGKTDAWDWSPAFEVLDMSQYHNGSLSFAGMNWHKVDSAWNFGLHNTHTFMEDGQLVLRVTDGAGVGAQVESERSDYLYGEFRASIKAIPGTDTDGICQGFFYYHDDNNEIDVEILSKDPGNVHFVVQGGEHFTVAVPNQSTEFHEYGFRWYPDRVEFLLDGNVVETTTVNIPQQSGSIILNNWTGNPGWSGYPPKGLGDLDMRVSSVSYVSYDPTPVVSGLSATGVSEGQTSTLSGTLSDVDDATLTVQIDWGDGTSIDTYNDMPIGSFSKTHTYVDDDADDTYTITVTAQDDDENRDTETTDVTVTNAAPANPALDPLAGTEDTAYTGTLTATDVPGDSLTWSKTGGAAWLSVTPGGVVTGTPGNGDTGDQALEVQVTDGDGGTSTATFTIEVEEHTEQLIVEVQDQHGVPKPGAEIARFLPGSDTPLDTLVTDENGRVAYPGLSAGDEYNFRASYEGTNPFDELGELWATATATIGTTASPLVMQRNWPYAELLKVIRPADGWEVPAGAAITPGYELDIAARIRNDTDEDKDVSVLTVLDRSGDEPWDYPGPGAVSATVPAEGPWDVGKTFTISVPNAGVYRKAVRTEVVGNGKTDAWDWGEAFEVLDVSRYYYYGDGETVSLGGMNWRKINAAWRFGLYHENVIDGGEVVLCVTRGAGVGAQIETQAGDCHYGTYTSRFAAAGATTYPEGTCCGFFFLWRESDAVYQEIDVEVLSWQNNLVNFVIHHNGSQVKHFPCPLPAGKTVQDDVLYGFRWLPDRIEFLVEGTDGALEIAETAGGDEAVAWKGGEGGLADTFPDHEGHILLNHWSGDDWSGFPPQGTGDLSMVVSSVTYSPEPQPPSVSDMTVGGIAEGQTATLTATLTDPDNETLTVLVDWGDDTTPDTYQSVLTGSFAKTHVYADDDSDDTYTITITATDDGGESETATVDVTVSNSAPASLAMAPLVGTEDVAYTGTLSATDVPGDVLTWTKTGGASWLSVSASGVVSGTPNNDQTGTQVLQVQVTDGDGGVANKVFDELNITPVDDPPVIESLSISRGTGTSQVNITYQITDIDSTGVAVEFDGWDVENGNGPISMHTLSGDGANGSVTPGTGTRNLRWDAGTDWPDRLTDQFRIRLTAGTVSKYSNRISLDTWPIPDPGTITGKITGGPLRAGLDGALVSVGGKSTYTRDGGRYTLSPLAAGTYTLTVSAEGYITASTGVQIRFAHTTTRNVHLDEEPPPAGYPTIVNVSSQYPNAFPVMAGAAITNRYTAQVIWNGTPGTVRFRAENDDKTVPAQSGSATVSAEFDMRTAFNPSLNRKANQLRITATNAEGWSSPVRIERPFVFRIPDWALDLPNADVDLYVGSGGYDFDITAAFPRDPIRAEVDIPSVVPFIGGRFGLTPTQASLGGTFRSESLAGSLGIEAQSRFNAGDMGFVGANAGGGIEFFLADAWYVDGTFTLGIEGEVMGKLGWLEAVPVAPVQAYAQTTIGAWLNDLLVFYATVAPSVDAEVGVGLLPEVQFKGADVECAVELKGGAKLGKKWVEARGEIGGEPRIVLRFPGNPGWLKRADMAITTRVTVTAFTAVVFDEPYAWHYTFYESAARAREAAVCIPEAFVDGNVVVAREALPSNCGAILRGPTSEGYVFSPGRRRSRTGGDETVLLQNVFSEAKPALAANGSQSILLFVYDDPAKADLQSTEIWESRNTGAGWSSPAPITSDTHMDLSPQVAFDGSGNAVAVWLRSRSGALADPEDLPGELEIAYSVLEAGGNGWSGPELLTDNAELDYGVRLSRGGDGSLLLLSARSSSNEPFGTSDHPITIVTRMWNSTDRVWRPELSAVEGADGAGITYAAMAWSGTAGEVVYSKDLDGDFADGSDSELFRVSFDGTSFSAPAKLTDDGTAAVSDSVPELVYTTDGHLQLVWLRGSQLVLAQDLDVADAIQVRERGTSSGLVGFSLTRDSMGNLAVIWPDNSDGKPDLRYRIYDHEHGAWAQDGILTQDAPMESDVCAAFLPDGGLLLAYVKTDIIREPMDVEFDGGEAVTIENVPRDGTTNLVLLEHTVGTDLQIGGISVLPDNPAPGAEAQVSVRVVNAGDTAIPGVTVALYDGDPGNGGTQIGASQALTDVLPGHASATLSWAWTVSGEDTTHVLWALVDPDAGISEFNEDNNAGSHNVVLADIAITELSSSWVRDDVYELAATVGNSGVVSSGPFVVQFATDSARQNIVGSVPVATVTAGWEDVFQIEWDATGVDLPGNVYCTLVPEAEESWIDLASENNVDFMAVTPPTVRVPDAPDDLTAAPMTDRIILTWTDVSPDEDGFRIVRSGGVRGDAEVGFVDAAVTKFTDLSVERATDYTYQVFAYNSAGIGEWSVPAVSRTLRDVDLDDLPDDWEEQIAGASPDDGIDTVEQVDADDDFDGDGVTNRAEFEHHMDATTNDTMSLTLTPSGRHTGEALRVFFGQLPAATDVLDLGLDTTIPEPSAGNWALYFASRPQQRAESTPLQCDFRGPSDLARWRLVVQAPDGARDLAVLSWDLSVADESKQPYLQPLQGEQPIGFPVDMKTSPSMELTAGAVFELAYGPLSQPAQRVPLATGWSLVGTRVMSLQTVGEIFASGARQTAGPLWKWDDGAYRPVTNAEALNPEQGVWVYSLGTGVSQPVVGIPADGRIVLRPGWNLVTPATDVPVPTGLIDGSIWSWDASSQAYHRANEGDVLLVGLGYWIFAAETHELRLGGPE